MVPVLQGAQIGETIDRPWVYDSSPEKLIVRHRLPNARRRKVCTPVQKVGFCFTMRFSDEAVVRTNAANPPSEVSGRRVSNRSSGCLQKTALYSASPTPRSKLLKRRSAKSEIMCCNKITPGLCRACWLRV